MYIECMYVCMYACTCMCACMCIWCVCVYLCICVYVCVYIARGGTSKVVSGRYKSAICSTLCYPVHVSSTLYIYIQ